MANNLKGKNCLVVGATGNVGKGAAHSFLINGAEKVFIVGRSEEKLITLKTKYLRENERAVPLIMNTSDESSILEAIGQSRLKDQQLDHIVSSSGPWWNTPGIKNLDAETWDKAFSANVKAHFLPTNT